MASSTSTRDESSDPFDAILNIEETKTKQGYTLGKEAQKEKLTCEGFNLGLSKGIEVGAEIGLYQALARTWLQHPEVTSKEKKLLEQLATLCREFPAHNDENSAELKQKINAKFKQVCANLKISTNIPSGKDQSW